jgi:N-acetylglutamate synthase-like GNAT family acetyltransferase
MIKIDLLKNHPHTIPALANIWYEVLGKIWAPDVLIEQVIERFAGHMNDKDLPITFIALDDLTPWLGSLVVDPKYQKQGIGKMLIDVTVDKAKELGFEKLYLFAIDPTIPEYYQRLGWKKIGVDEFKSHPVTVMEVEL